MEITRDYFVLRTSPDPVLREIGEALHRGALSPAEVFAAPAYREALSAALSRLQEVDVAALREAIRAAEPQTAGQEAVGDHGGRRRAHADG